MHHQPPAVNVVAEDAALQFNALTWPQKLERMQLTPAERKLAASFAGSLERVRAKRSADELTEADLEKIDRDFDEHKRMAVAAGEPLGFAASVRDEAVYRQLTDGRA